MQEGLTGRVEARLDGYLDAEVGQTVCLALSGGGDSMALLLMTADWARARGRRLLALTVNHNLNPDSAAWTRVAGEAARAAGADWRGLSWDQPQGGPGLTARARAARHGLMAQAARDAGARVVLLAHTLDDVAEADWMRAEGSTLGRVREWSPSPVWPEGRGLMLLRPLLNERREALRDYLRARGQGWIEDPANRDIRFGRSRARMALRDGAGAPEAPAETHLRADACDVAAVQRKGTEISAEASPGLWAGVLTVSRQVSGAQLAAALVCAGGGVTPPRGESLAGLLAKLRAGEDFTAGLCGARIEANGTRVLVMCQTGEMRRKSLKPLALLPGVAAVWDGRFEMVVADAGWQVVASEGRLSTLDEADRRAVSCLPIAARGSLPVLTREGKDAPVVAWRAGSVRALVGQRFRLAMGQTTQESELFCPVHGETPPTDLFSTQRLMIDGRSGAG